MILTKEQQEGIVENYVKEKHNTDSCLGFIDGINATIALINKLSMPIMPNPKFECNKCGGRYEVLAGDLGRYCLNEVEGNVNGFCGGELIEITKTKLK